MLTENIIDKNNKDLNENIKVFDAWLENTIQGFTFGKQVQIKNSE